MWRKQRPCLSSTSSGGLRLCPKATSPPPRSPTRWSRTRCSSKGLTAKAAPSPSFSELAISRTRSAASTSSSVRPLRCTRFSNYITSLLLRIITI
ncbi:unnamed protein product [Linum tenue]|uniref:Uncharacterized protein n=1 Tax=Linum tenue TaxID=586396 RepID=A0AAV0MMJ1_9ROSI|nr:unnamed protein product [Linum tenue]